MSKNSIDPNEKIIEELDINPRIAAAAQRNGYTTSWNILISSCSELQQKTGLSANDVDQLMCAVASYIVKPPLLPLNFPCSIGDTSEVSYVSSGCNAIDNILKGGIPFRGITEITGQSGSGKTQVGLQLALRAQLPKHLGGFDKCVAYICTESQFPAARLQQMVVAFHRKKLIPKKPFTDNLLIHHIPDMDSLADCVQYQLPVLVKKRDVGLLIIDSIAAVFRVEEAGEDSRYKTLQTLGYRLHKLAMTYNVAVLAINQVTSALSAHNFFGIEGDIVPALGLSWANLVTTRLMISKTNKCFRVNKRLNGNLDTREYRIRKIQVISCPWLSKASCNYLVTEDGVEDLQLNNGDIVFAHQ
ncbi:unnamed protein product [Meganyctiphanes norvegica]|uniref:RecA family profile 1 domain-containing protein n=1 Tax=Meganyctiphanes norvegica TaxID=48144 RepID=A0AAV2PR75_MEGNR